MLSITHDPDCRHCTLGKMRAAYNSSKEEHQPIEYSVGGSGPRDLTKVRLIVISDFCGAYEAQNQIPQFDSRTIKNEYQTNKRAKTTLLNSLNAGATMRMALQLMYGLNTYNDCWITNAVKCNPMKVNIIVSTHLKPCMTKWMSPELAILDHFCPEAPMLIAGGVAFNAINLQYPQLGLKNLNSCRRRGDIRIGKRPVIFTDNSAKAARSQPKIESEGGVRHKNGRITITKNEWLFPVLPGTPVYSFIEDLKFLSPYLTPKP